LSNAVGDARFGTDPYLVAQRPKSVLSVALAAQRRLVGVLYLENAATANAFFPARLELTALLASQAAIAIDNARLAGADGRWVGGGAPTDTLEH
jgi:GAF domain-containing protein